MHDDFGPHQSYSDVITVKDFGRPTRDKSSAEKCLSGIFGTT